MLRIRQRRGEGTRTGRVGLHGQVSLAVIVAIALLMGCAGEGGGASQSAGPSKLPELSDQALLEIGGKLQGARAAIQKSNPDQAIEFFQGALQAAPDGAVLHYHLAVAYGAKEQPAEALAEIEKAVGLGLSDVRMVDREELLGEVRELPGWAPLRARMLQMAARSRRTDTKAYERLDPAAAPDFPSLDELIQNYEKPLGKLTMLMMVYPSDIAFPEIWKVLNEKMAALEKYARKENLAPEEQIRLDHEFLQTASGYESQNRTPWLQSTVKLIEEKTNAFIERHPNEGPACAQAFYLQNRVKWLGMVPADWKALDQSTRLAGVELMKAVDKKYPGSTGGLLAMLDALDLLGEGPGGINDPAIGPLVDLVREHYANNPALPRLNYRLLPYVLGAHGLPELKMTDLDGRTWDTKQLGHKATLIDFWATWCQPCRRELPNLVALYQEYRSQGFEIVGVSVDDGSKTDDAALRAFAQQQGMTWPLVYDKQFWNSPIVKTFGVSGIPFPILVDEQGRVVAAGQEATGRKLRTALKKTLG